MTVKDLIEQLQKVDPDLQVVLSSDNEGNSFSILDTLRKGVYEQDSPFYVEVDETDRSEFVAPNCITLYPES